MRVIMLLLLLCKSQFSLAQTAYHFSEPAKAQAFQQLLSQNRCLVCQNQALAGSSTPFAETLKHVIYEKLRAGETPAEIELWLTDRYGQFISYDPPWQRNTVLLWTLPLIMLRIGAAIFFQTLRSRTSTNNNG